jgi:RHS repeat-associated protein
LVLPPFWIANYQGASKMAALSDSAPDLHSRKTSGSAESLGKNSGDRHTNVIRSLKPSLASQSFGIVLTPVNTPFNGSVGISHHQPTGKLLSSSFSPSGQPKNFELIAADGIHTDFSNVAGISGELRIATARDDGQGTSLGGFTPGELFTSTSVPGAIARLAADGSTVQNPWVILPDETGLLAGGLHLDRTGVFGGDLIAVTTLGGVWRIAASGQATRIADLDTRLEGVTVVPNDLDRYGPWAGKILTGAKDQGLIYAIDTQGTSTPYQFGINPEDITVIAAHENFYGIDPSEQKIWGASANAFSSIIGDVLIAQETPGTLSRVHWNGTEFEVSQIGQVTRWKQITFSPAGIAPIPAVRQIYDRIAVVRHAPLIDSGRVEGALWQLTGEATTLDGTDVITSDLLVPGTPTVTVGSSANYEGTIQGTESTQPAGYPVTISGNSTLRHLITRTNPIQLETVEEPTPPLGTRDVTLNNAGQSAGEWTTLRNLTLSGQAGAITVPPGTYGAFASGSHNAFVFGVANSTQPAIYNLESLALTGSSELILNGPVILTVKNGVTLVGSTIGAAANPRQLLLRVSSNNTDAVKVSGTSVLYGIVRAPQGTVTIEGHGRLRGTVSCDRLVVNGAGILQITESDIPPPPINRPPTVNAGAAQTITLPDNTVNLNGTASDDGLPQGSTLSVSWSKVSGPGVVIFTNGSSTNTDANFSEAGTYVLRLTADDSLLTSSDDVTINVVPHNQPPIVNAGPDKFISLPNTVSLNGFVSDDALPSGSTLGINWTKVSGPGDVTFTNANAPLTTASFSVAGVYTLRLTANDSEFEVNDEVIVMVAPANEPPIVNAGLDRTITLPNNNLTLTGTAIDDGLPASGVLTVAWLMVSGPAAVTFGNPNQLTTTVTFSTPGIYLLRLIASDTQFTGFDEVAINVKPALINLPPQANAGADQTTTLITTAVSYTGDPAGFSATTNASAVAVSFDDLQAGTDITGQTISGVTFDLEGTATTNAPLIVVNGYDTFTPLSGYSGIVDATKNKLFPTSGENILSPGGLNLHPTDPLQQNDNIKMTFAQPVAAVGFDLLFQELDLFSFVSITVLGTNGQTLFTSSPVPTFVNFGGGVPGGPVFFGFVSSSANISKIIIHDSDGDGVNPDSNIGIDSVRLALTVPTGDAVNLHGTVSDDGLPNPPATVSASWSKVSGPGTVTFGAANQPDTTATFSAVGTYVLRLTANDSQLTGSDDVTVTVNAVNHSPIVSAGLGQTITLPNNTVNLAGSVSDDGKPVPSTLSVSWSQVFGPGQVTFGNPNVANTTATFSAAGTYVLKLTASDGQYSNFSHVSIGVNAPAPSPTPTPSPSPTPSSSPTPTPAPTPSPASPAAFAGPISRSVVSGLVPITLAQELTLTDVSIDYWPVSNPSDVHVLITGAQGGPGEVIAVLDTTLLANDSYVIRLRGTPGEAPLGPPPPADPPVVQTDFQSVSFLTSSHSLDGDSAAEADYVANPSGSALSTADEIISEVMVTVIGDYKPGRVTLSTTDFTIPVAGIPVTVGRTYDSLERGRAGDFGNGWSVAVGNPRLEVNPAHDVTLTQPDGRRVTFRFTPRSLGGIFSFLHIASYTPEPGVHGNLISDGCGLMLRLGDEYICTLSTSPAYEPSAYQYTDPQGRAFVMTADGVLRSIKDLHGNIVTFDSTGITSSAGGLNIPFERDSSGRITRIVDPAGNAWRYEYDTAGNLSMVRLPGITDPIIYTYDASHLYTGATDPRGNVAVTATYYPDGRIASATDAAGNTTGYEYNLSTLTTTITNPDGGHHVFHYDSLGQLLSETDELGRTTTYTYDPNRNRLTETNALGQVTRYTYDEDGNQTSVTDPQGNISRMTYNDFGGPATAIDQLGNVRTVQYDANFSPVSMSDSLGTIAAFTFDSQGNPLTFTDSNGATTHFTYDVYGNLLTRADPLNRTTTYTYDQVGRIVTVTDPRGHVTHNAYDALGRLGTVTDELGNVTTYEYDANGNKTAQVDALGRRTTFTYDAANRLTRITYPNSTTINYTYNFRDQKLTETDQAGRVTTYTYDLAGQLTRMKYVDNTEVIHAYDAIGRETATTDERGNTTHYEYDPACTCNERMSKVTDALNNVTVYKFDVAGRLTSVIDAATRETRFTYDVRKRLTLVTYPDATTIHITYDPAGHQLTQTDQAGRLTSYGYDAAGELTSVTDALNHTTNYSYDPARNLISVTDANNHITNYEYDVLNRLTKRTLPLGMSETLAYDAVGNRTSHTDFRGKQTTYSYDSLNRLLRKTPHASLNEPVVNFTYTPTGQRATMVDGSGTTTYTYNNRDRLTSKSTPQGTLSYTYDAVGNVLSLLSSNANGASVNYSYDAVNRLQSVTDNRLTPGTTTYSYDAVNNLTGVLSPNGVQATLTYDALDDPTNLTLAKGGVLWSYAYTYNAAGQRLSATEKSGRTVSYSYDASTRLTTETIANDPNAANGAVNYFLDAVGNRLTRTSTLSAISSSTSTYDANDRLNSEGYDANGNTTSADGKTYTYNFENRIKSMNAGALTVTYDGDGNRVAKTVGGVATGFLVDDLNPTGYAQVIEEIVGGSVQRTYTYGNTLVSQKQLGSNQSSFYNSDTHGSVRLLMDSAGAVTDTYDFDAFGNLISATGTTANDHLYSGERFDSDLGVYYLRERYYNPQRGRFLTSDSFEGFVDKPRTLHRYAYVGNDPVNFIDPSGLAETLEHHLNVVRLRCASLIGLLDKAIVIGETMSRVMPVAEMLGALPYNARTPPFPWANNSAWLRRYLRAGYQVIDIGFDPKQALRPNGPSIAYPKELDLLARWAKNGKLKLPVIKCIP